MAGENILDLARAPGPGSVGCVFPPGQFRSDVLDVADMINGRTSRCCLLRPPPAAPPGTASAPASTEIWGRTS
eukprot:425602-Pyramimonas_sp.AAC.1